MARLSGGGGGHSPDLLLDPGRVADLGGHRRRRPRGGGGRGDGGRGAVRGLTGASYEPAWGA